MPTSRDPVKRETQLANLKRGNPIHGATSETAVRPLRERFLAELRDEFPTASERRLAIQAHRLAQLELLAAFTDERGVIAHRRRGSVFAAAAMAERIATSYLAEHDRLEAQQRQAAAPRSPQQAIEAVVAEAAEEREAS